MIERHPGLQFALPQVFNLNAYLDTFTVCLFFQWNELTNRRKFAKKKQTNRQNEVHKFEMKAYFVGDKSLLPALEIQATGTAGAKHNRSVIQTWPHPQQWASNTGLFTTPVRGYL